MSAVNRFQDIAGEHADHLGLGIRDLLRGGHTWILHQMRMTFSRMPGSGEDLKIRTWYCPERDLYSLRNFSMEDVREEGTIFAEFSWVVLDLKRGRPVRLSSAMPETYGENRSKHFPTGFREIPEMGNEDGEVRFYVRFHDLDINHHVNNAHYFEWTLEAIPIEALGSSGPVEVEALFRTPTRYGEEIISQVKKVDNSSTVYLHRLQPGKSKETCALLRTEWPLGMESGSRAAAGI